MVDIELFKELSYTDHVILLYAYLLAYNYSYYVTSEQLQPVVKIDSNSFYTFIKNTLTSSLVLFSVEGKRAEIKKTQDRFKEFIMECTKPPHPDTVDFGKRDAIEKTRNRLKQEGPVTRSFVNQELEMNPLCDDDDMIWLFKKIIQAGQETSLQGYLSAIVFERNNIDEILKCYKHFVDKGERDKLITYIKLLADGSTMCDRRGLPPNRNEYYCYTIADISSTREGSPFIFKIDIKKHIPADLVDNTIEFYVNCNNPVFKELKLRPPTTYPVCSFDEKQVEYPEYLMLFNLDIYRKIINLVESVVTAENPYGHNCPLVGVLSRLSNQEENKYIKLYFRIITNASEELTEKCKRKEAAYRTRCEFKELLKQYRYNIMYVTDYLTNYNYSAYTPPMQKEFLTKFIFEQEPESINGRVSRKFTIPGKNSKYILVGSALGDARANVRLLHELAVCMELSRKPENNTLNVVGSFVCDLGTRVDQICSFKEDARINMILEIPAGFRPLSEIIDSGSSQPRELFKILKQVYLVVTNLETNYTLFNINLIPSNIYVKDDNNVLITGFDSALMMYDKKEEVIALYGLKYQITSVLKLMKTIEKVKDIVSYWESVTDGKQEPRLFVDSLFSESFFTTIGKKLDKEIKDLGEEIRAKETELKHIQKEEEENQEKSKSIGTRKWGGFAKKSEEEIKSKRARLIGELNAIQESKRAKSEEIAKDVRAQRKLLKIQALLV